MRIRVDKMPEIPMRCPGECKFSIGKATPFDCDYDECTIDGKPCVDVEDCKVYISWLNFHIIIY